MGRVNTGMERATELTVYKTVGGFPESGYPHTYKLYDAFENYVSMTKEELSSIKVEDYKERLDAFKEYIDNIEMGVLIDTGSAYRKNVIGCPINNKPYE